LSHAGRGELLPTDSMAAFLQSAHRLAWRFSCNLTENLKDESENLLITCKKITDQDGSGFGTKRDVFWKSWGAEADDQVRCDIERDGLLF